MQNLGILTAERVETPDGPFIMVADREARILASGWTASLEEVLHRIHRGYSATDVEWGTLAATKAVEAYYAGDMAPAMGVPVLQWGTPLQQKGWNALRKIPAGEPLNYTQFAERVGNPAAVRAAASICAKNAPALFVPCHRVLRSDGTFGGFAWGTKVKESLLDREQ